MQGQMHCVWTEGPPGPNLPGADPDDIATTETVKNVIARGSPVFHRNASGGSPPWERLSQNCSLTAMGTSGPEVTRNTRGPVAALNHCIPGGHNGQDLLARLV